MRHIATELRNVAKRLIGLSDELESSQSKEQPDAPEIPIGEDTAALVIQSGDPVPPDTIEEALAPGEIVLGSGPNNVRHFKPGIRPSQPKGGWMGGSQHPNFWDNSHYHCPADPELFVYYAFIGFYNGHFVMLQSRTQVPEFVIAHTRDNPGVPDPAHFRPGWPAGHRA